MSLWTWLSNVGQCDECYLRIFGIEPKEERMSIKEAPITNNTPNEYCDACSQAILDTDKVKRPAINGERKVFHKRCWKMLKSGNALKNLKG